MHIRESTNTRGLDTLRIDDLEDSHRNILQGSVILENRFRVCILNWHTSAMPTIMDAAMSRRVLRVLTSRRLCLFSAHVLSSSSSSTSRRRLRSCSISTCSFMQTLTKLTSAATENATWPKAQLYPALKVRRAGRHWCYYTSQGVTKSLTSELGRISFASTQLSMRAASNATKN